MSVSFYFLFASLSLLAVQSIASFRGPKSKDRQRGVAVDIRKWPHAVFLHLDRSPYTCGSSLITPKVVVTSAYCLRAVSLTKGKVYAYLGATVPHHAKATRRISSYKVHPKYHGTKGQFDLSVAKFFHPVPKIPSIRTIPIGAKGLKFNETTSIYVAGWGTNLPAKSVANRKTLKPLVVSAHKFVSMSACTNISSIKKSHAHFCTVSVDENHYKGDWGDGLVIVDQFQILVGLVSYKIKGATLYTNLLYHKKWISQALTDL